MRGISKASGLSGALARWRLLWATCALFVVFASPAIPALGEPIASAVAFVLIALCVLMIVALVAALFVALFTDTDR